LPAIDACFGVRSAFRPSRAFIHVNDFLSSSNSSLSGSGLTRTALARGSTPSPCRRWDFLSRPGGVPSARNFRLVRKKALPLSRISIRPVRGPKSVAVIPFMRSGIVREGFYQGFVVYCGLSCPVFNVMFHHLDIVFLIVYLLVCSV